MKPETLKRANEITARIEVIERFFNRCSKTLYPESIREKQEIQSPAKIKFIFDEGISELNNTAPINRELAAKVAERIYDELKAECAALREELEKL